MSLKYDDFDLQIERAGEKYRVRLLNAPTGQASGEFVLPFSDIELGNFLSRIGQVRRGMRRVDAPELHAAKEFGGKLFSAVFCGEMIAQLRGSMEQSINGDRGLRIRLRLTDVPELADLPWEFLYDASQNHFLTTSTETPLVRFLDLPQRIAPLRATLPLRLLVMIAGPRNLKRLDAEGEWARLQDALSDLVQGGHLVLERLPAATLDALRLRARGAPFHIFHFIGHGGFDSIAEDGVLQFEDENGMSYPVRGEMLGMQLHDHRSLRLAVLNACEGARSSRQDPFSGVAQSLLQQRVPAVIAMQFEISDVAAKVFAREFYRAIAEGNPVDAAVCESRKALFKEEYGQEWATPVLYMRSQEGVLFDLEAGPAVESGAQHRADSGARLAAATADLAAERDRQERGKAERERVEREKTTRQEQTAAESVRQAAQPLAAPEMAAQAQAARVAADAKDRQGPETVAAPVNVPVNIVDAEDLAAAAVGPLQSAGSGPTSTTASMDSAREVKRSTSSARQIPVPIAALPGVPSPATQAPARLHLPAWLVLLIGGPLIGLVLALSWHHLRGHHDDGLGASTPLPASAASSIPNATPAAIESGAATASMPSAKSSGAPVSPAPKGKGEGGKDATATAGAGSDAKSAEPPSTAPPSAAPAARKPAPARPVAPPPLRVTPSAQATKIVNRVNPTYPMLARQTHISGEVQLRVLVAKDGTVKSVEPISGHPLLAQSAMDAVKQWRYQSTLVNGEPVEVETTVPVDYKLNEEPAAAAKPAPCTLGKIELQDQGNPLIGSVPYTYMGGDELQHVAVRGTPLGADKKPVPGLTIGQYTLRASSGTASFSIENHPSMGHTPVDGQYLLVAIVLKSSGEVVCGEMMSFQRKW